MIMIWGSYLSLLDRMLAPLFFTMFIAQSAGGGERAASFHLCCWYCRCWNIIPKDVVLLVLGLSLFIYSCSGMNSAAASCMRAG